MNETDTYAGWLTKEDVAGILGTSAKTVERLAQRGELTQAFRRVPGRRPLPVYDPADVERERLKTVSSVQPAVAAGAQMVRTNGAGRSLPIDTPALSELFRAAVDAALEARGQLAPVASADASLMVPTGGKLVLTLVEASALAGIPKKRLRAAVGQGALTGYRDTLGRGWRIKRSDLERWVDGL